MAQSDGGALAGGQRPGINQDAVVQGIRHVKIVGIREYSLGTIEPGGPASTAVIPMPDCPRTIEAGGSIEEGSEVNIKTRLLLVSETKRVVPSEKTSSGKFIVVEEGDKAWLGLAAPKPVCPITHSAVGLLAVGKGLNTSTR